MNRLFLLAALAAFIATTGCKQAAPEGYEIRLRIAGMADGPVYLAHHLGSGQFTADTARALGGEVLFKGPKRLPRGIYMAVLPPKNRYVELLVGQDQHFSLQTDTSDFVGKAVFEGSEDNEVFYQDLRFLQNTARKSAPVAAALQQAAPEQHDALMAQLQQLDKSIMDHRVSLIEKHPQSLYAAILRAMRDPQIPAGLDSLATLQFAKRHWFDELDFAEEALARTPVLESKLNDYFTHLVAPNPDSMLVEARILVEKAKANREVFQFVVKFFVNRFGGHEYASYDEVFLYLAEQVYDEGYAFWADAQEKSNVRQRADVIRPTRQGAIAPGFVVKDEKGNNVKMYDLRGEWIIVYFWDYECTACREEYAPKLAQLYRQYKDRGVNMLTVSVNGNDADWKKALQQTGLAACGAFNTQDHRRISGLDKFYDVSFTPRVFLLNRDRYVIAKYVHPDYLTKLLAHYVRPTAR